MTGTLVGINELGYRIGEGHHNSTISDDQVKHVRDLHERQGLSVRVIAELLDMSIHTIRRFCDYSRRGQFPRKWQRVPQDSEERHDGAA